MGSFYLTISTLVEDDFLAFSDYEDLENSEISLVGASVNALKVTFTGTSII